jgi:Ca-activated chloride channel family protein
LLLATLGAGSPGHRFLDLWMTPDQQGRHYFDRGDFKAAAARFEDPAWKGVALYRSGDFEGALNAFALQDTPESYYNQGNALACLGKYPEAARSYGEALKGRPGWKDARENLALVQSLIPPPKRKDATPQGDIPPTYSPDQVQFDDTKGQKGKVQVPRWDEKQMADLWLRNIQTTPADFLRQKFAIQAQESAAPAGGASP